jgi:1-acyl-sn-glycerol-3-phosphate acyltransferase
MIDGLKKILRILWRVWFYILVALLILVFAPFLILFTLSEKTFVSFYWIARNLWARPILYGMGCIPKIQYAQKLESGKS